MNDLTTGGGISEALKRRYGISDERPVATLATDLFPVVDASDGGIPDLAWPAGVRLCSGLGSGTAVAAQFVGGALRNPADSGVIATVRSALITGQDGFFRVTYDDPGSIGSVPTTYGIIDTRSGVSSTVHQFPACQFRHQYATATPQGVTIAKGINGVTRFLPVILVPGSSLILIGDTLNTSCQFDIQWQERKIELWESDRAF